MVLFSSTKMLFLMVCGADHILLRPDPNLIFLGFVLDLFELFEESSILRSGLSIDLSVSDLEKLLADVLLGEEWQKSWVPCHRNDALVSVLGVRLDSNVLA